MFSLIHSHFNKTQTDLRTECLHFCMGNKRTQALLPNSIIDMGLTCVWMCSYRPHFGTALGRVASCIRRKISFKLFQTDAFQSKTWGNKPVGKEICLISVMPALWPGDRGVGSWDL